MSTIKQLPFEIPKSLYSYCELLDENPEKATHKLRKHLMKRGLDPVGNFLLGCFYYLRGRREEAIQYALKAKIYAPGSHFLSLSHYFFSHPDFFNAWTPENIQYHHQAGQDVSYPSFHIDLEQLIQALSEVESKKISLDRKDGGKKSDLSKASKHVDDIISETLAKIHEQQGKLNVAVETYEKLMERTGNKDRYKKKIKELKKKMEDEGSSGKQN